jgi:hypothetical protein
MHPHFASSVAKSKLPGKLSPGLPLNMKSEKASRMETNGPTANLDANGFPAASNAPCYAERDFWRIA